MDVETVTPSTPLPPAPGADEHVSLELANSAVQVPTRGVVELLDTPAAATRWLVERGLAPEGAELQDYCAGLLTDLRGPVRALFDAAVRATPPPERALAEVNRALTLTPTAQLLGWNPAEGFHRVASHPTTRLVEHALVTIAADAVSLVTGHEATQLATCGAEPCNRYMLRTHARRHWCSKRCGDRVRAARSYARRTADADS
ncbi:CGNR zinc finger domain-containing protein [Saccharopolyspora sp. NPDC049357]|uniref:CGNR zinc finger domain-containing protein n=1 Tax=Saccharopolyspora sp. NPDC049357 TaxID=3154507 RepID=UPI003437CA6F